jgi:hypothetical protein
LYEIDYENVNEDVRMLTQSAQRGSQVSQLATIVDKRSSILTVMGSVLGITVSHACARLLATTHLQVQLCKILVCNTTLIFENCHNRDE